MVNLTEALGDALDYMLSGATQKDELRVRIYNDGKHLVYVGQSVQLEYPRAHLPASHTVNRGDTYELYRFGLRDFKPETGLESVPHGRDYRLGGAPILEGAIVRSRGGAFVLDNGTLRAYHYSANVFPYHELDYVMLPEQTHIARLSGATRSDGVRSRSHWAVPRQIDWVQTLAITFRGNINPQGILVPFAG